MTHFFRTLLHGFGLMALIGGMASAQPAPGKPWSLQETIDYALKNNLQVQQNRLVAARSRIDRLQARENLLPSLNGSASENRNFGTSLDPFTYILTDERIRANNFSLSTNVTIFSGLQLQNNIRRTALEYEATLSDVERAKNDLILEVITTYTQVIFGIELLQMNRLQLENTRQQADRTQKLFRAGSVPEANVLEINAQLASDELAIINAQNQIDLARLRLVQLLNLPSVEGFEVIRPELPNPAEEIIAFNAREVFEVAQQNMPEVRAADLRVRSSLLGVEVSRGGYYPTLSLGAGIFSGYSNQRMLLRETGEIAQNQIGFVNVDNANYNVFTFMPMRERIPYPFGDQLKNNFGQQISANLRIPIFNGMQVRNNVARAKIAVESARVSADLVRNQLRQMIEQQYTDALAAQKRYIATLRQQEALAQAFRNAEVRFNSGVMNVTDYNVAANNLRRTNSELIQARYEYIFKLKVLDFYQGKAVQF